jgi:hypothetical protein
MFINEHFDLNYYALSKNFELFFWNMNEIKI